MRLFFVLSLCSLLFLNISAASAQDAGNALPQAGKKSAAEVKRQNVFSQASDTQIEEAQRYYKKCKNNTVMSERKDCKCAATMYLETRLKLGNGASVEQIIAENVNSCLKDDAKAVNGNGSLDDIEVTEKQREEAEHIYQYCKSNQQLRTRADCECLAANFLQERITTDPIRGQDEIIGAILINGKCKNLVDSTGQEYTGCMAGSGYGMEGLDQKKYCECYARTWAKALERHTGKIGPATKNSMRLMARMTCKREVSQK
ncbi:MAG: hypothetical protein ACTHOO_04485 [Alcanivorax sp.]